MAKTNNKANTPDGPTLHRRWTQIQAKLKTAKPLLVTEGSVVRKAGSSSREVWVVRYRDRRHARSVQRTIYLGDGDMAERAKSLINRWRMDALTPDDHRRQNLIATANLLATSRGYSARARNRLRTAAINASADPRTALEFVVRVRQDDGAFRLGKRPGRPAKAGLW